MSDDIGDRIATLIAERDEARAWVRRLTADARVLTCAKHPMRAAEAVEARLRDIAANAIDHVNDGELRAELRAQLTATVASAARAAEEGTEAAT